MASFSNSTASSDLKPTFTAIPPSFSIETPLQQTDSTLGSSDDDYELNDDDPTIQSQNLVFKYYFLFVILGIVLVLVTVFYLRQRRKRQKNVRSHRGRDALARDVERWQLSHAGISANQNNTARRWWFGYNRFGLRAASRAPPEDGLNELGEAPPPYKAEGTRAITEEMNSHGLQRPSSAYRPLNRSEGTKPPDYSATPTSPSTMSSASRICRSEARESIMTGTYSTSPNEVAPSRSPSGNLI